MSGRDEACTGANAATSEAGRDFLALSVALTGFDAAELEGTGMLAAYLEQLIAVTGERFAARFVEVGARCLRAGNETDVRRSLKREVLGDEELGPVARALIALWYTGQWFQLPRAWRQRHGASPADETRFLTARSYREGLVWTAAGAHPIAAKPMGFGGWSLPPNPPGGGEVS